MTTTHTMNQSNGSSLEIAQSNQDLIMTKGKRKKRAWIIGGTIALIILAIIVAALFLFSTTKQKLGLQQDAPAITLEDYLEGKLTAQSFNATWMSGYELIYRDSIGNIVKYDTIKNSKSIILLSSTPIMSTAFEYEISPDHKFLLIAHDYQKLYRHSYVAQYTIVNLETMGTNRVEANDQVVLQYATWGPLGNALVYVAHYNIFYRPSALSDTYVTITTDGLQGHIYNGIPDWVYEEEVFSSNKAIWLSPDGKKMAYAKFNDTNVPIMTIPVYGQPGSLEFQYTRAVQIRYPKPGTKNPDVSLHVVDLSNVEKNIILEPPKNYREPVLATVAWATNKTATAIWMNRVQNAASIICYETTKDNFIPEVIKSWVLKVGWMELFTAPIFSKDGKTLILILSQEQSKKDGSYRHVTLFERKENSVAQALTTGKFVVTEILSWNEDKSLIYYQATTEKDPAIQHVYSVSTKTKQTKCISCGTKTKLRNMECLHNSGMFSKDNSHYVLQCAGPDVPEIAIYKNINDNKTMIWEDNEELTELINEKLIPKSKRMTFTVPGEFEAQVMLKLPPNMDTSGDTQYPMLVNVYGGPDSFQVVEKFGLDWGSYLAANKSIIYATIDGRGSGLKGDDMLFALYRNLGTVEIEDQINVTRQIQKALPYVDDSRTAIWGWSYGGYASAMALASDTDGVFKCGISVAPVTDWALYDSIYTERYMGLPITSDNYQGYYNAQLLNKFEGLRNKQYYLVHGTLDDNVHYQQSMMWSKVLEQKDIMFRQQTYPDEEHSLSSVRPHLYHSLENFLDECFIHEKN